MWASNQSFCAVSLTCLLFHLTASARAAPLREMLNLASSCCLCARGMNCRKEHKRADSILSDQPKGDPQRQRRKSGTASLSGRKCWRIAYFALWANSRLKEGPAETKYPPSCCIAAGLGAQVACRRCPILRPSDVIVQVAQRQLQDVPGRTRNHIPAVSPQSDKWNRA